MSEGAYFVDVGENAAGGDGVAKHVGIGAPRRALDGEILILYRRRQYQKQFAWMVGTR